jgi:hypothetical protein
VGGEGEGLEGGDAKGHGFGVAGVGHVGVNGVWGWVGKDQS